MQIGTRPARGTRPSPGVLELGFGAHPDAPTGCPQTSTEVELFVEVEEGGIKPADAHKRFPSDQQRRSDRVLVDQFACGRSRAGTRKRRDGGSSRCENPGI